jgi:hypothetical protein
MAISIIINMQKIHNKEYAHFHNKQYANKHNKGFSVTVSQPQKKTFQLKVVW